MPSEDDPAGRVELSEAIEALRGSLERARAQGMGRTVQFTVEPVELSVKVALTRVGKGTAGIRWNLLTLGGEKSRQSESVQTLTLRLTPVVTDGHGHELPEADQRISGSRGTPGVPDQPLG
ncbi:trypco2 family protein [Streptomyces sp. NPDC049577]|uniref:trypco2 family protein n=1 Tax=Streptomyces sp. NPDC049577 TaxID=3155153 RepID=UPI00343B6E6F